MVFSYKVRDSSLVTGANYRRMEVEQTNNINMFLFWIFTIGIPWKIVQLKDNHVVGLCSVRWALSVGANLLKRDTHPWKMSYACSDTALYWAASSLNLLGSSFDLWSLLTTRCGVLPVSSEIAECVLQIVIEFIKPSVTRWSINESRYCILKTLNMDKR